MNESPRIESSAENETFSRDFSRYTTFLYALTGIILPLIAFACAAPSGNWSANEPWQTSEFWVYATLVLKWPAVWPFYPLLLASMTAMALFLWDRARFSQWLVVRIGLYGGVSLAALFCWLIYAPTDQPLEAIVKSVIAVVIILGVGHLGLLLIAVVAVALFQWLKNRWGWRGLAMVSAFVVGVILAAVVTFGEVEEGILFNLFMLLFLALAFTLAASPAFALAAYAWASLSVARARQETRMAWSIKSILGLTTWVACQLGAWRQAMNLAIAEYATLPTESPGCYICSAAARGHRRIVGSEPVLRADGAVVWISRQLRVFKAAELALLAVAPQTHQRLRRVYNAIGPRLAARVRRPLVADIAYIALKPLEWCAAAVLWSLGIRGPQLGKLYSPDRDRSEGDC